MHTNAHLERCRQIMHTGTDANACTKICNLPTYRDTHTDAHILGCTYTETYKRTHAYRDTHWNAHIQGHTRMHIQGHNTGKERGT